MLAESRDLQRFLHFRKIGQKAPHPRPHEHHIAILSDFIAPAFVMVCMPVRSAVYEAGTNSQMHGGLKQRTNYPLFCSVELGTIWGQ